LCFEVTEVYFKKVAIDDSKVQRIDWICAIKSEICRYSIAQQQGDTYEDRESTEESIGAIQ